MKNAVIMLSICFLIFISWLSSFSNNKTLYSCDPEINSWMINNIEEIEKISLNNLLEEDPLFQKVIFSALSPKKKAEIFNEKIDFVLNLNWSNAQRNAIKKFGKFIYIEVGVINLIWKPGLRLLKDCSRMKKFTT